MSRGGNRWKSRQSPAAESKGVPRLQLPKRQPALDLITTLAPGGSGLFFLCEEKEAAQTGANDADYRL